MHVSARETHMYAAVATLHMSWMLAVCILRPMLLCVECVHALDAYSLHVNANATANSLCIRLGCLHACRCHCTIRCRNVLNACELHVVANATVMTI